MFETERLIVRKPEKRDAVAIFDCYATSTAVTKYLLWQPHATLADTKAWIDFCMVASESEHKFVIELKERGAAIGMVAARIEGGTAELGYVLGEAYWGRGIMPEAVAPVVAWLKQNPVVTRIQAYHDTDNPASGRVLEKLGLVREGVLEKYANHPNVSDELRDVVMYGVVLSG